MDNRYFLLLTVIPTKAGIQEIVSLCRSREAENVYKLL